MSTSQNPRSKDEMMAEIPATQKEKTESSANQTLYLSNLNDKIRQEELRFSLYYLFSQFGEIYEIIMKKSQKMRGQAFILFKHQSCAVNALNSLQHFSFFGKPIVNSWFFI